jgi:hypothetical protein
MIFWLKTKAVGGLDAASEPDGNPDVDSIVTGWRASGGVETGPDRRSLERGWELCGIRPRCCDQPAPPPPPLPDEMPVVLQPGTELVVNKHVFFDTDPRIESKSGKCSEERLCSLQQSDQNLHGLGPPFTHQFHHQGRPVKNKILRFL